MAVLVTLLGRISKKNDMLRIMNGGLLTQINIHTNSLPRDTAKLIWNSVGQTNLPIIQDVKCAEKAPKIFIRWKDSPTRAVVNSRSQQEHYRHGRGCSVQNSRV